MTGREAVKVKKGDFPDVPGPGDQGSKFVLYTLD